MYALPLQEHTLWLSRKSRPSRRSHESRSCGGESADQQHAAQLPHIVNNNSRNSTAHGRSRLTAPKPKPGGGSTCDAPSPCEVDAHSDSPSNAHEGLSLTAPEPEPSEQPLASSREHPPLPDLDEYEATPDMDCDDERWECDTDVLSDDGSHPNTHTNVKALRERKHIYQISYHQNGNCHPVDTHGAAARRPRLDSFAIHCHGSTASPPRLQLNDFASTATARRLRLLDTPRRPRVHGHGLTASPTRLQLDGLTSIATAPRLAALASTA